MIEPVFVVLAEVWQKKERMTKPLLVMAVLAGVFQKKEGMTDPLLVTAVLESASGDSRLFEHSSQA